MDVKYLGKKEMEEILIRIKKLEKEVKELIEDKKEATSERNTLKAQTEDLQSKMFWLVR